MTQEHATRSLRLLFKFRRDAFAAQASMPDTNGTAARDQGVAPPQAPARRGLWGHLSMRKRDM